MNFNKLNIIGAKTLGIWSGKGYIIIYLASLMTIMFLFIWNTLNYKIWLASSRFLFINIVSDLNLHNHIIVFHSLVFRSGEQSSAALLVESTSWNIWHTALRRMLINIVLIHLFNIALFAHNGFYILYIILGVVKLGR